MKSTDIAWGLQLSVNLAAKDKMIAPRYQELPRDKVPHVDAGGISARVIAGSALGTTSPVYADPTKVQCGLPNQSRFRSQNQSISLHGAVAPGAHAPMPTMQPTPPTSSGGPSRCNQTPNLLLARSL